MLNYINLQWGKSHLILEKFYDIYKNIQVDRQLNAMMCENSIDFTSKFAKLAKHVAGADPDLPNSWSKTPNSPNTPQHFYIALLKCFDFLLVSILNIN